MKWVKLAGAGMLCLVLIAGGLFLGRHELNRFRENLPPFTHRAGNEFSHMVPMADGVSLYTTVELPAGEGPFPAVLVRNPYAQFGSILRDTLCGRFVRYGYGCVLQDARGQGESEGEWEPGFNEIRDGRDTLRWLVRQDFQDGNVALVGPSYLAAVQWAAAASGLPPEVKTIVPSVYATNNHGVMYQDGMFRHETFTAWASMMRTSNAFSDSAGEDYQRAIRHRPHREVDTEIFGVPMPWYQDMINGAARTNEFWQLPEYRQMLDVPKRMTIPVLMIGGWYDVFLGPQFDDWQRLATRDQSRFVIGPWTHIGGGGEALETPDADGGLFQWAEMLPWLEQHLKGKPAMTQPGLRVYTMRDNSWKEYRHWPPETSALTLTLAGFEEANDCDGGRLVQAGESDPSDRVSFTYDPEHPVPTRGGAGMLAFILPGFDGAPPANVWQDGLCERADVLSFLSDPFEMSATIAGNIDVRLRVSSTAEDTAFTAKLIEVLPDGRAVNIRDSITSLAFRNGSDSPVAYEPGQQVELDIRFWPIEWTLQPGSRLRLDVSSSDFPKYHAHSNQGGNWADAEFTQIATQTIHAGSRLSLHIREDEPQAELR